MGATEVNWRDSWELAWVEGVVPTQRLTRMKPFQPFLFDGYKFDLRLYVLVTSVSPLRVYIFEEGLVRLATIPYQKPNNSNMRVKRMHLTNYAVNRKVEEGDTFRSQSCKKSLLDLNTYLADKGISAPDLWTAIDGIIVKTLLSALPQLRHVFHATCPAPSAVPPCFEMLGFDILLDEKLKPYLLEVNRSPSLVGSAELDRSLKTRLITNVLDMVLLTQKQINLLNNEDHLKSVRRLTNPNATRHLSARERILAEYQPRHEESRMGRFRRLYPEETGRYEDIERVVGGSFNQQRN